MAQHKWDWIQGTPRHLQAYEKLWSNVTIGELAAQLAERQPDSSVFPNLDGDWSYKRIYEDAKALVFALQEKGLEAGDVISFQTPNWPEACVINVAAALGGYLINPIVIIYRHAELRYMLADCRAKVFFVCESFNKFDFTAMMGELQPDLPDLDHIAYIRGSNAGNSYEALIARGHEITGTLPKVDPKSIKLILYTSGTTGRPKAVLHSHNTLARAAEASLKHWKIKKGSPFLMPSPVTHISGYSNGLELPFIGETRTILMESWNAEAAVKLIDQYNVAGTVAATPFLQEMVNVAVAAGKSLPSLISFACGGAAVPPEIVRTANTKLANSFAFRVFGSSEVPLVTLGYQGAAQAELAATTDGEIVDYEVRIVDDEGKDVPQGHDGEIWARGPAMMLGYADPQDTKDAISDDGFFKTGDIGFISPEGALVISGRKKDLIIRGGENISAKEIEDVLHQSDQVREAAIVAMPHARLGEGICAFIIAQGPACSADDLLKHVAQFGLAKQKTPERFVFVEDFPRTASGKIRKDQLRIMIREIIEQEG